MSSSNRPPQPLSGDGGVTFPPDNARDPFAALDDLMQVVEALCPTWPEREIFSETGTFKL